MTGGDQEVDRSTALAGRAKTGACSLEQVVRDVFCEVLSHAHLSLDQQISFATDDDWRIRRSLATNLCLAAQVQIVLADDIDQRVQDELARNPSLAHAARVLLSDRRQQRS